MNFFNKNDCIFFQILKPGKSKYKSFLQYSHISFQFNFSILLFTNPYPFDFKRKYIIVLICPPVNGSWL